MDTGEINLLWGRAVVAKLAELGVQDVAIAPGSRSTPLTFAFAESSIIEAVSVLDERSAGFFALGSAKASGIPSAVVCTSGSAVANLFPAVVEARMAGVLLLVLTADRPPELQDCHAGQTIDQKKLFGRFVRMFTEVEMPSEPKHGCILNFGSVEAGKYSSVWNGQDGLGKEAASGVYILQLTTDNQVISNKITLLR